MELPSVNLKLNGNRWQFCSVHLQLLLSPFLFYTFVFFAVPLAMKYSLIEGFDGRTSCVPPINVRSRSNVCLREAHFVYHTEVKFMTFQ